MENNEAIPENLKKEIAKIPGYAWWILGIIFTFVYLIYIFKDEIKDVYNKEYITIDLKTRKELTNFQNTDFIFQDKKCEVTKIPAKINIIRAKCERPKMNSEYQIKFGSFESSLLIELNKTTIYNIDMDEYDTKLTMKSLRCKSNVLEGDFQIVHLDNSPKYADKNNLNIKLYSSDINATVKDSLIHFTKKCNEFSNIYYQNCKLSLEFEIENKRFYSQKRYFFNDSKVINQLFSLGSQEHLLKKTKIEEYLQCANKKLQIKNLEDKPNINLLTVHPLSQNDINGYIKFKINNINKDTTLNFYISGHHIFRLEYPFFKFDMDHTKYTDSIAPNQKISLISKTNLIESISLNISRQYDECEVIATMNGYPPSKYKFKCQDIIVDDKLSPIFYQLNVEKVKDTRDTLFEISDMETGLDPNDSLID